MIVTYIGKKKELMLRLPELSKKYDFTESNSYREECSIESPDIEFFLDNPRTFKCEHGVITKEEKKIQKPSKPVILEEERKFKCRCGDRFATKASLHLHQSRCEFYQRNKKK